MGRLGSSLTEKDVDRLILCLYSHDIISQGFRDELLNPLSHRTQLLRTNNLLCNLESKIRDSPQIYQKLTYILVKELNLRASEAVLSKLHCLVTIIGYDKIIYKNLAMHCSFVGESISTPEHLSPVVERDSKLSHPPSKHLPVASQISMFSKQLMETYISHSATFVGSDQKWSCINNSSFYINLAIIKKKERVTFATADPFTRETIERNEDVDSILKRKQQIDMEDVLKPEVGSAKVRLQIILVQGAAGVGKSTFALEMAKKWSVFKEMKSFQLVLLVQLRQPLAHRASSIHDLLQLYGHQNPALLDQIAKFIVQQDGEDLLLILDGFDELPSEVTSSKTSFYIRLLQGDYLSKATIILTTRPSVISRIQQLFDARVSKYIEIVGFLSTQVDEFARKCLTNEQAESFLKYIYSYPHIKSMMYIPLNTAIMVKLYCNCTSHEDKALPMTLTQLYTEFCLYLLQCCVDARQLEYNQQCPEEQDFYSELKCMPEYIQRQLKRLAEVAFRGISEHTVVFHDLPMEFDHMDFMNKCERLVHNRLRSKLSASYNFLHLTVQEFLAAYHISCQPVEEQVKLLQVHSSKQHFSRVWRFLAGLTAFNGIGWDVFNSIMNNSRCGSDMKICKSLLVNCLYEAQDPSICSQVLSDCCAVYSPMSVTHYDYYSLGYCVANCPCTWKLCSIGGDGLAMLAAGIKSSSGAPQGKVVLIKLSYNGEKISDLLELPESVRTDIAELNLGNCGLTNDACNSLSRILPHFPNLNRLDIADNPFTEGSATGLLKSMSQLAKISYLDLLHANLNIDDLDALAVLIRPHGTLESLIIGGTNMHIRVVEKLLNVVLVDSQLRTISIMNLDLALFGAQLRRNLEENTTLLTLMLWDRSFCIEGCIEVVRALEKNQALKSLTLMPWYKFHIPETLFELESNNRINWFYYPKQK